jgi:hypothetical protein
MSKRIRRGGLMLALPLAALSLAGGAAAHKQRSGSFLELNPTPTSDTTITYAGRVNSASRFCRAGRAVQLHVGGIRQTTVTTDRSGAWSTTGTRPPVGTEVTAVITRTTKRSKRHRHVCGGDTLTKKAQ